MKSHVCTPSPVQHLVKLFSDRCYEAVRANPSREIGDIYKQIRNEFTKGKIFLKDKSSGIEPLSP